MYNHKFISKPAPCMQDHGYCGFAPAEEVVAEVAASRHLVHWGLMTAERTCSLEERLEHYGCPYDKVLQHAPEQHAALFPRPALPCFVPTKDTVIPSSVGDHLHPETLQPEVGTLLLSPPAALLRSCMLRNGMKRSKLQRHVAEPAPALHSIQHHHHTTFCCCRLKTGQSPCSLLAASW